MKHEGDQGKPRRQTKLLQNNGKESLKGGRGYSTIVAWRGEAGHGQRRLVKGKELATAVCVRHAWLCLAAAGVVACVRWRRARWERFRMRRWRGVGKVSCGRRRRRWR